MKSKLLFFMYMTMCSIAYGMQESKQHSYFDVSDIVVPESATSWQALASKAYDSRSRVYTYILNTSDGRTTIQWDPKANKGSIDGVQLYDVVMLPTASLSATFDTIEEKIRVQYNFYGEVTVSMSRKARLYGNTGLPKFKQSAVILATIGAFITDWEQKHKQS